MKAFGADGILYKIMQGLVNIVKINFLWMLFSLPIVTLGGATVAAFDVCMKMEGGEDGYVARDFVKSFRKNFKSGIPYGLLFLFCCYVVWLDFSLFEQLDGNPIIFLIMGMVAAFVFLRRFLFAFALQARYENTLLRTLKNSADISTRYFVKTLTLLIAIVAQVALFSWNVTTVFIGFLVGPACIIFTVSGYARRFFREIEKEPGAVTEKPESEKGEKNL